MMTEVHAVSMLKHFDSLPDPRSPINLQHRLIDVIVIAVCGVIVGCDGPTAIRLWAKEREAWLGEFLELPNGLPSRDCLRRVLSLLEPTAFNKCFSAWTAECLSTDATGRLIAIDGKTLRRSHNRRDGLGPLHVVSAWASDQGISLGQLATDAKSNEITAIPELLEQINVKGAVVTIDAMGCQKAIAKKITAGKGDYVLMVKGNQEKLYAAIVAHFDELHEKDFAESNCRRHATQETGHGRVEQRYYYHTALPESLKPFLPNWSKLKTIGQVLSITIRNGKECHEKRYYISSLKPSVKQFARAVRGHWAIENSLHWVLDVTFNEDQSRAQDRRLADNLATLRRLAVGLLKQHPSKESIRSKQRIAGWSNDFLTQVLALQAT